MTAPIDTSFYADPKGLAELRGQAQAQDPAALRKVAEQFESIFTKMMLKSMRQANDSFGDSLFSSQQTEFYEGMFDDQIAVQLSQGRGMGLADMLVRQLSQLPGVNSGQAVDDPAMSTKSLEAEVDAPVSLQSKPSSPQPIASSKEDFVRALWPHAARAAQKIGVDPNAVLAQAALETGWGKSVACTGNGDCSFNLFGIKAGSQWSGATASVPTLEFEEGIPVKKVERFRSYESAAQSFDDYARLIADNPRYESARGTGSDIASFASALQQGGYATDPHYARKIVAVANELAGVKQRAGLRQSDVKSAEAPLNSVGGV
jgi:flagellar protein FlgJ